MSKARGSIPILKKKKKGLMVYLRDLEVPGKDMQR
jgi:hypothetical protein